jgi:hypothetical protein
MTEIKRWLTLLLSVLLWVPILAGAVTADRAAPGAAQIDWQVIGGGAAPPMLGEGHQLYSTLGQVAAGFSEGGMQLGSGFWYGAEIGHSVFLPVLLK